MRLIVVLLSVAVLGACGGGGGSSSPPPPPANRAPTAGDITIVTLPGTAFNGVLSATDADGDTLTFSLVDNPANGAVVLSGTGSRDFEYTPNGGFAGADSFTFSASDGSVTSNTATVSIAVNTPPVVTAMSFDTSDIGTVSGTIAATDAEGDSLTFAISAAPTKGTLTTFDSATGDFVFTPTAGEDGMDSFSITAADAAETSAPGVFNIEIFGWGGTQQFGSAAFESLVTHGLLIEPDGTQLQLGSTDGQVGSTPNAGGTDLFVRRLDRRGNQTFIAQFGDAVNNGARGLFHRPQGDGYYVTSSQDGDTLYRFDSNDTEIYSLPLPVTGGLAIVSAAYWSAVDEDGNIYALSWLEPTAVGSSISGLVSKVNGADGSLIWQRELRTSVDEPVNFFLPDTVRISPRGIDFDSTGNPVITGQLGDNGGSRPCSICGFIAKLDANTGANVWVREPDAFANCSDGGGGLYRVTVASDDTLYMNGIASEAQFPGSDGLVARYSADGTQELWSYCDNSGADTTFYYTNPLITSDGGLINYGVVGDATSPPASNGGPSAFELVVDKFDANGTVLWTRRIGATRADGSGADMYAGSVAEDSQGVLYITGATDGELTSAANAGDFDAFVIRLGPDGSVQ